MSDDPLLSGLDTAQREAVTTTAMPLAVVAAAGAGKTRVLTRRIAHRVREGTADARHVLALTFTRDAAGELQRRLRALDMHEPVDAGTFHSIALRLLRDRAEAKLQPAPQVADDRLRLVRECITQLRLQCDPYGAMTDIDWARARLVEPQHFQAASRSEKRRSAVPAARFGELFDAYSQLKRRRGVLDFDDLLNGVLQAMRSDPSWAEAVRWRYRHFFVDEAQDMNPLQLAVLEALRDGRPDLCLVGDPRQAIYGWNGADHTTLSEVERRFPGVTVLRLGTNHRCSPEVVRAGAAALGASGQADTTSSSLPEGRPVTFAALPDEHAEAAHVAHHVRDLLLNVPAHQVAVLARTNELVGVLQRALTSAGINTQTSAATPLQAALLDAYRCPNRERLAEWVEHTFLEGDPDQQRVASEADRYLSSSATGSFRTWVDTRTPFDHLELRPDTQAVSVLTFHGAKGREWWAVVVAGTDDSMVPHASASTPAQLHEEARLFYVAITRAERHLHLTHALSRNGRTVAPSRWLAAVEATVDHSPPVAPPPRPATPADPLAPLREWRMAIARSAGLSEQAVCSDRVLRSLLSEPPTDLAALAARLGITETAAARLRPLPA
ncbi:MAG: ATP-dependent helicase [Actinomycetota bacterium]